MVVSSGATGAEHSGSALTLSATSGNQTVARPAVAVQQTAHAARHRPVNSSSVTAQPKICAGSGLKPHACSSAQTTLTHWTKKQHRRNGILDLWSRNAMAMQ